ncbi:MAG TPA: hypothetical protein VM075_09565 [Anaerolineae bacterium]|nr:hypothetical protein [Anaerolineae bacterium]
MPLFGKKKGITLGKAFVPLDELPRCGLTEAEFICAGDTREAALDRVRYRYEVALTKQAEADWAAFAALPRRETAVGWEKGIPSIKRQESLGYMGWLWEDWRLEQEKLVEKRYSSPRPQLSVRSIIEQLKDGYPGDMNPADILADQGCVDALAEAFPDTLKWDRPNYADPWGYMPTLMSEAIAWALARLSDPKALAIRDSLEELNGHRVYMFWPKWELQNMAIQRDVDALVAFLEEMVSYTTKVQRAWDINPKMPWEFLTWPAAPGMARPEIRQEWEWTAYVLKQWGDRRAVPVLQKLYPIINYHNRPRIKELINRLS